MWAHTLVFNTGRILVIFDDLQQAQVERGWPQGGALWSRVCWVQVCWRCNRRCSCINNTSTIFGWKRAMRPFSPLNVGPPSLNGPLPVVIKIAPYIMQYPATSITITQEFQNCATPHVNKIHVNVPFAPQMQAGQPYKNYVCIHHKCCVCNFRCD